MKLSSLTDQLTVEATTGIQPSVDPDVKAVCYDSRKVIPGAVFVAIEGFAADGHRFIPAAVKQGAVAVVCRNPVMVDAVVIRVADPRAALALLSSRFYGQPAGEMILVGVTGTNGKTTVTYLLEQMLKKAGHRPGVVGTINYRYAGKALDNPVTTPESLELQAILRQMADAGVTHAVMEVSSHALDLHRVDGCRYDAAVFTNLTQDHLDHHGDMDRYWACKKRLFVDFLKPADADHPVRAVVNGDDPRGQELVRVLGAAALRTAIYGDGDILPFAVIRDLAGIRGSIVIPGGEIPFASPLVGEFNLENILSAAGAALVLGIPPVAIAAGIDATPCVPGRLERIAEGGERTIFVDYAHTPDALENAIAALRTLTPGRLITVFGCGGDRDNSKRPIMGEIAARLSDLAVVSSDNPRSEDPLTIIAQVEAGVRQVYTRRLSTDALKNGWQGNGYMVEPDRRAAIGAAIGAARKNDAVLIAGKGHETYQILANETIHFDDREVARQVLAAMNEAGA
ncbi:MAG: UDP-N-acetylmuramoyl-L-alanyl-D-glutamate--2,6-diaminopimelate ligase [Desulfosarcina sp.]|nr:UDP-N-acetylmuramoyl-L-alanyl-D-glutamate--2,6-diaminopimelate ligase [Desulfosarcina sp.]MBC2742901.1 UDP-N-acetylmuramoyl-L-alanyl-D-glutamate--2,6-diaminopimelate ligase [Desulfosarcina sp.]MBC2765811.1 UDP-N-acetylmuramoyl-L-alanyl-D-glutamate--2,6-diaminopimelate ligase [Desulfosarcina sp.]